METNRTASAGKPAPPAVAIGKQQGSWLPQDGEEHMHSQEPWQSRSPTGNVNKSMNSFTLKDTGRRGSNHSYGRGLPVKRNALIILTVAILAFAMIPAIGVGAATAQIKIVTPHELAAPSDDDDSAFENLAGSEYVSTVTGDDNMANTYGTLYAVIEDNDNSSNTLTTYTAYFNGSPTGSGVEQFNIASGTARTASTAIGTAAVYQASHSRVEPDPAPADDPDGGSIVSSGFMIADRDKSGGVGSGDVTVYLLKDADTADTDITTNTEHLTTTRLPESFIVDAVENIVHLNLTTRSTDVVGVRIEFATATEDSSTAQIRSAAGDEITIDVTEKDLSYYEGTDDDGITGVEFAEGLAGSVDSGTFVGNFGLIPNAWKKMINNWATDAEGDDATVSDDVKSVDIAAAIAAPIAPATATPVVQALVIDVGTGRFITDANADRKIDHMDIEIDFAPLTGHTDDNFRTDAAPVAITPTDKSKVEVEFQKLSDRGDLNADLGTEFCGTGITNPADADLSGTTRVACVAITTDVALEFELSNVVNPAATPVPAETDGNANPNAGKRPVYATPQSDKISFSYTSESNIGALLTQLEEDTDPRHAAFDDLGDDREGLMGALEDQARNLNTGDDDTVAVSALVGRLLGVENLGTVEVLYRDPSPRSTRRASATVDLVKPTVGGLNPAKGSFTTRDSFDMLFTVTDTGAGIPEDAEDPGENTVGNTDTALVDVAVSVGPGASLDSGDEDPDVNETREEIGDGYQYELDVRINRDTGNLENITVTVTITAYDLVGNRTVADIMYIVDTKDPILQGALTGVGAKINTELARDTKDPATLGAYEVILNDPTWLALVFDDAINGANLGPGEVIVAGKVVESVLWLDKSGANVITTEGEVSTSVTGSAGSGLDLDSTGRGQDARHVLFVKLADPLDTSDRPAIEIDGDDLEDLAGNEDVSDHTLARAHDRLGPKLTVTVNSALSKDTLDVTVTSSEELRRPPSASITAPAANVRDLTIRTTGTNEWSIQAGARAIGQTTGGIRTISVSGEDENGNRGTKTGKWELDVEVNGDMVPVRVGEDRSAKAHAIEINPITFLSLEFANEADEYTGDSKKTVSVTGASLETLSAGSIKANDDIAATADIEVTGTAEVDAAAIQTSDSITYVIALSEIALGNYRLKVNYEDVAGNADSFGYVFQINPPAPEKVKVVPGWSLVSIPGTPADKSIGGVLEGSAVTDVWSLNNETKVWEFARQDENGEWMGTLTQMSDGRAYFVRSTTFDPISVLTERFSPQRTPSQYTVTAGWNGIGYTPAGNETQISVDAYLSSLGASGWGMIRAWDASATPPQYETYFSSGAMTDGFPHDGGVAIVQEGKGYLLFATRNGVIGG